MDGWSIFALILGIFVVIAGGVALAYALRGPAWWRTVSTFEAQLGVPFRAVVFGTNARGHRLWMRSNVTFAGSDDTYEIVAELSFDGGPRTRSSFPTWGWFSLQSSGGRGPSTHKITCPVADLGPVPAGRSLTIEGILRGSPNVHAGTFVFMFQRR